MLPKNEYQSALGTLGPKFNNVNIKWDYWFMQYAYYESMWEDYFRAFISTNLALENPIEIQFVFWESCPGGMPFPHQNYALDSSRFGNIVHGVFDKYLKNESVHFGINNWKNQEIGQLIKQLSQKGVLIIDLYPTHGIDLSSRNNELRIRLFNQLFNNYSIALKLTSIGDQTSDIPKSNKIKITQELWNAGINNTMDTYLKINVQNALGLPKLPEFYT